MALHRLDGFQARAFGCHELIANRQKPFGDDVQARRRHQMMDVGDAAGDRILDRDHAEIDVAGNERSEAVLECRAGHRLVIWIGFAAGKMRICARFSLKDDLLLGHVPPSSLTCIRTQTFRCGVNRRAACAPFPNPPGVSTPSGTLFTTIDIDAHAGVERAQLLEFLTLFIGRRRQFDEAFQSCATIRVEPDMMIVRSGAGRVFASEVLCARTARRRQSVILKP